MNISEKIILLRQQQDWSQEELASLLGVSRQAVSKWELGDSTPDLERIIRMAELFQISTDMLVRDDLNVQPEEGLSRLSDGQAQEFIETRMKYTPVLIIGIMLCILAPIPLIVLPGGWEAGYFHALLPSADAAALSGLVILLALIVIAVGLIVYSSSQLDRFEWMETSPFLISQSTRRQARHELEVCSKQVTILTTAGICLIILGVIPLVALSMLNEKLAPFGVGILLAIVAIGAPMIIYASNLKETWQMLLEEGDFTPARKQVRKKYSWLPGVYWCVVTAIYLIVSFLSERWEITWVIMMAAGILYGAIVIFLQRKTLSERSGS